MATILAPVSVQNQISQFASGTEGLAWNTHGSHIVLTLAIRLLGVDDPIYLYIYPIYIFYLSILVLR